MIAARFVRSLKYGTALAVIATIVAGLGGDVSHQAALAHMSPAKMLAEGFAGLASGFTIIMFILFSVFPRRRPGPPATSPAPWENSYYQQDRVLPPEPRTRQQPGRRGRGTR